MLLENLWAALTALTTSHVHLRLASPNVMLTTNYMFTCLTVQCVQLSALCAVLWRTTRLQRAFASPRPCNLIWMVSSSFLTTKLLLSNSSKRRQMKRIVKSKKPKLRELKVERTTRKPNQLKPKKRNQLQRLRKLRKAKNSPRLLLLNRSLNSHNTKSEPSSWSSQMVCNVVWWVKSLPDSRRRATSVWPWR